MIYKSILTSAQKAPACMIYSELLLFINCGVHDVFKTLKLYWKPVNISEKEFNTVSKRTEIK